MCIRDSLRVQYETSDGIVKALNGIDLSLEEGMTLGLVGETGAGKTTLAKSIMRIIPQPPGRIMSGEIIYDGKDILKMDKNEIRKIRGQHISMIFQDPMTSLNPVMTVGEQIAETIKTHEKVSDVYKRQQHDSALHLYGLVSDGGVHSHITHIYGLLELAKKNGLDKVFVHCFLDGRDPPPASGKDYVIQLEEKMKELGVGRVASVMGRYYAMDRDNRWDRVEKAYKALTKGCLLYTSRCV